MRSVQAVQFGGPEVLKPADVPAPVVRPGHVVVGVGVAEVLFVDTQIRSGWGSGFFPVEPPYVPGAGVAGTVLAVGDGVDGDRLGRRVIAETGFSGGYTERALAPIEKVVNVPDGVDLAVALAALHDGTTALSRVEKANLQPGEQVLVTAAAGSLGAWLIPSARAAGARVIATARGARKLEQARKLGANVVVDYTDEDWTLQVVDATGGRGLDVVFDGAGGETGGAAFDLVVRGGRFFAYGAASGDFAAIDPGQADARGVHVVGIDEGMTSEDRIRLARQNLEAAAAGTIAPVIGATFPLEQADRAHAAIEARAVVGKTVLEV